MTCSCETICLIQDQWYPEVLHFCPYTPLVLVGLKSDLRTKRTCIDLLKTQGLTPVTQEQGMAVANKMGARYMECSSKEMTGVDEIFRSAINTVVQNDRSVQQERPQQAGSGPNQSSGGGGMRKKKRTCKFL
jgi:Ras family protein A